MDNYIRITEFKTIIESKFDLGVKSTYLPYSSLLLYN